MIFTNANDTSKKEGSMLSYYNYTSKKPFSTYEPPQMNKYDKNNESKNNYFNATEVSIMYSNSNYVPFKNDFTNTIKNNK
jgi:hypothetical protein